MTYEVRFGIDTKKAKNQVYRVFTTQADSYGEAIRNFIEWANNGEQKFDYGGKPYKFKRYPVSERDVVSVMRWD